MIEFVTVIFSVTSNEVFKDLICKIYILHWRTAFNSFVNQRKISRLLLSGLRMLMTQSNYLQYLKSGFACFLSLLPAAVYNPPGATKVWASVKTCDCFILEKSACHSLFPVRRTPTHPAQKRNTEHTVKFS